MLKRLDPDSTFDFTATPILRPDVVLRFRCRYITLREELRLSDERAAAVAAGDDAAYVRCMTGLLQRITVEVSGLPTDVLAGYDGLPDVLTAREFHGLYAGILAAQAVSETDLGKSPSQPPTAAAASAGSAVVAGA